MGCFGFFPSENFGAAGDAGIITTSDAALADRLRLFHVHGARDKYVYELLGMNSRLDALQAAILRVKLKYLDNWAAARQRNADSYRELFREFHLEPKLTLPVAPPQFTHVYNQFTIRSTDRDNLREHLRTSGIPSEIYYPIPLHLQRAFSYLGTSPATSPHPKLPAARFSPFPYYPELTEAQQRSVVTAIAGFHPE